MRSALFFFPVLFLAGCCSESTKNPESEQKLVDGTYYTYTRRGFDTISFSTKRSDSRFKSWFEKRWEIKGDSIFRMDRFFGERCSYSLKSDTLRLKFRWEDSEKWNTDTYHVISATKEEITLVKIHSRRKGHANSIRTDIQLR
ncbi:hypothetical protein D3C87_701290 [compost metagenome]